MPSSPNPTAPSLIDSLLARDEFNDFWSLKWGDLLRIKSEYPVRVWPKAVAVYYQWVHDSLAANKPYDQFARELLTATGSNFRVAPANFVRAIPSKDARTLGETAALVFMGAAHRLRPLPRRTRSKAGASTTISASAPSSPASTSRPPRSGRKRSSIPISARRCAIRARAPWSSRASPVAAALAKVGAEEDPRGQFAAWLTAPENPWFARNIVNRIWFWLLGRGIVHEPDDLRPTNPPVNPELLAYLESELVDAPLRPAAPLPPDSQLAHLPALQPSRTSGTPPMPRSSRTTR